MKNLGYQENHLPFQQAGLGNEVLVLCSKHHLKKRDFGGENQKDIVYQDRALEIKRLRSLYIQFPVEQNWFLDFRKEIDNFAPEAIHLHNIWALPSIQLLMTNFVNKKKVKLFVDDHIDNGNFLFNRNYKSLYYFGFIKKVIIPWMLNQGFLFLSVNPFSFECLRTQFGISKERIRFLPLGVDSDKVFFSQEEGSKIRNKYGINKNDIVFVFSGVFEQTKALTVLIDAFKILARRHKNIFLLMIGEGELFLDQELSTLKANGRIIFPGWQTQDDLYRWYSVSDVGVLPGKLGGIRDILSAGRPLIISDDLAVSYLTEYNNGVMFKRGDVEGLIRAMEEYIKNPVLIKEHGEKSLRLVNEKLSWKNISLESLRIYRE